MRGSWQYIMYGGSRYKKLADGPASGKKRVYSAWLHGKIQGTSMEKNSTDPEGRRFIHQCWLCAGPLLLECQRTKRLNVQMAANRQKIRSACGDIQAGCAKAGIKRRSARDEHWVVTGE